MTSYLLALEMPLVDHEHGICALMDAALAELKKVSLSMGVFVKLMKHAGIYNGIAIPPLDFPKLKRELTDHDFFSESMFEVGVQTFSGCHVYGMATEIEDELTSLTRTTKALRNEIYQSIGTRVAQPDILITKINNLHPSYAILERKVATAAALWTVAYMEQQK